MGKAHNTVTFYTAKNTDFAMKTDAMCAGYVPTEYNPLRVVCLSINTKQALQHRSKFILNRSVLSLSLLDLLGVDFNPQILG